MKALTLIQPWAYAVCYLGKRIENRTWAPPAQLSYGVIAIHAGRHFNDDDALWLHETLGCGSIDCAQSAVVATARVQRVVEYGRDLPPGWPGIPEEQRRWAFGPLCWVLGDVQVLREPVSCRGMQGLWQLPPEVEALVVAAAKEPAR